MGNDGSNVLPYLNGNMYAAELIQKHLIGESKDSDKLPVFSFGKTIRYCWPGFKHRNDYNVAKYSNLKQECLQNKIYSISMEQFQLILAKAVLFQQSEKGRGMEAVDG